MKSVLATAQRFKGDTRAAVLIYVTATLPVIIGTALLAIDASRLMGMHTSLQKAADALAIAGAAELDRFPQSIQRSEIAIQNLVKNTQFFGNDHTDILETISNTEIQTRYFASIPADDAQAMVAPLDKANADAYKTARFVEVTIQPRTLNTIFPASFLPGGGVNSATATVVAVAGNDQVVCKLMPLFICNPLEPSGNTDIFRVAELETCANSAACKRRLLLMRAGSSGGGGGNAAYFPGDFGFLDMGSGATDLARALAIGSPETCFLQSGVDTEPGQMTGPVENGINVRFGLYPENLQGVSNSEMHLVPPDINVRKAQDQSLASNKICKDYVPISDTDPTQGQALPKDDCFLPDPHSCSAGFGRQGDGGWEARMDSYWNANYGSNAPSPAAIKGNPVDTNGNPIAVAWSDVTRYDVYKYEIDQGLNALAAPGANAEVGKTGTGTTGTQCYSNGPGLEDRRILNGAILNCIALEAAGFKLSGSTTNLPVVAFAEFFITQPLRQNPPNTSDSQAIFSELVRVVKQGQGGNATSLDQVQLYR